MVCCRYVATCLKALRMPVKFQEFIEKLVNVRIWNWLGTGTGALEE